MVCDGKEVELMQRPNSEMEEEGTKWAQGKPDAVGSKLRESNRVSSVALRQSSPVHKPESNPEDTGQCCAFKHSPLAGRCWCERRPWCALLRLHYRHGVALLHA